MMGKLVRDKIPEIIAEEGRSVRYRRISGEELKKEVVKKLAEEYKELINAVDGGDVDNILEECADVFSIVHKIAATYSGNPNNFHRVSSRKNVLRGGFDSNIYLEEWDD